MQYLEGSSIRGFFGSRDGLSQGKFYLVKGSGSQYYAAMGNHANVAVLTIDTSRHVFVLDAVNGTATVDGGLAINVGTFTTNTTTMFLFTISTGGTLMAKSIMRLYSLKISNRMDLIPVRVGTTGYMYDRVSRQLFGNAGTGDFIVGPDKN